MDPRSYIQGLNSAGKHFLDYCEDNDLESVYDCLPSILLIDLKSEVNKKFRKGVVNLLGRVVDYVEPGASKVDYYSRLNLSRPLTKIINDLKGLELVNKVVELGELLEKTYTETVFHEDSFDDGVRCFYEVVNDVTSNGLAKLGSMLSSSLNNLLSILKSANNSLKFSLLNKKTEND